MDNSPISAGCIAPAASRVIPSTLFIGFIALQSLTRRRLAAAAACALAAAFLAPPAFGDEHDAINLVLGASLTHDANVFRLPDNAPPLAGFSTKSDRISVAYAGVRIDKPYAQQRFQLDATNTSTRYDTFSFLNFDTFDYRGAWLWSLTPHVSGTLGTEHKQALVPFSDYRGLERNVRTSDSRRFSLDGWIFGGWHLLAGASQSELKNDVQFLAQADSRFTDGEAAVKYVVASDSWLALTRRSSQGDYLNLVADPVNLVDNRYRQEETEIKGAWNLGGKSVLNGRLASLERRHEHFAQRNFSGTAGQLDYTWAPTDKLRLPLSAKRDISSWWESSSITASSSYRVTHTISLAPTWQVDAKTAVRLRFDRMRIDYRGPVNADPRPARGDTLRSAQVALDWTPLRSVAFSASLERDSRATNNPGFQFGDTIGSLSVSLMF
jgi:exopolysaccharide biosynthesis operon protein EpsL